MAILTINNASCALTPISYGLLYNGYVAIDVRGIANTGWHVPTYTEMQTLSTYVGGSGISMRETGTTYWGSGGGTNIYEFNARGNGIRSAINGVFSNLNIQFLIYSSTGITTLRAMTISGDLITIGLSVLGHGRGIRLLKDSTSLSHGQSGTYTGNNGKKYRTICIGTQEWLADNLAETKYNNSDWISGYNLGVYTPITDVAWIALTSGALCAYDDDWNNV